MIGSGKNVGPISQYDSDPTSGTTQKKSTGGRKKRKYGYLEKGHAIGAGSGPTPKTMAWTKLSQDILWKSIGDDSHTHFGFRIPSDCCDSFVEWSGGAQRSAIIRRFCIMNGVQIMLKNYQLNPLKAKSQAPFSEDDVSNVVPVVKRLNPRSQSAYNLYLSALIKMQQGFIRIGYDLMQQAHSMMNSIYGPLHSDLALCLRFMARMAYALNDFPDALTQQHRALLISERCNGIDHYETISDYINLAHFSFANLCIPSALKLLYRARHLLMLSHGEQHPYMGQIDANIGIILYALQEFDASLKFLNNALTLYQKYGVPIKTALLHHVIARAHSCRGDFRTALSYEKETFNIYSRVFGKEHEKTLVSNECLRHLTKQAVNFQKHMNDATQGLKTSKSLVPNFQIQPPSLPNIVELLNAFNNLLFWKLQIHTE
uniref:EIF3_p135 domain-containing protein n=1 Tax=Globodera pallida TaxID=36090 RepID=A0A183C8G3_GLOPA